MEAARQQKERPILFSGEMVQAIQEGRKTQTRRACRLQDERDYAYGGAMWTLQQQIERCPYGRSGDRLWVRETWTALVPRADGQPTYDRARMVDVDGTLTEIWYRADGELGVLSLIFSDGPRWRSSMFMPRWASRITLEIVGVSVERVQSISEDDARAEGVADRAAYAVLWDKLNAKRGYSWASNPWVWVIEFKVAT